MDSSQRRRAASFSPVHYVFILFASLRTGNLRIPSASAANDQEAPPSYGVDVSFPMHYHQVSTNYPWLPHNVDPDNNPTPPEYEGMPLQPLGDRKTYYEGLIQGCREHFGADGIHCDYSENDRIRMGLEQPRNMKNFTALGFKKIRAPHLVFQLLREFWEKNQDESKWKEESWSKGYTYVNYWDTPSYMVNIEDAENFVGAGMAIKKAVWDAAKSTLEQWTGQRLKSSSLYGIRVYKEGHFLATHVDRLPLVSSAIINVAQDVDEPWPIEVVGHDGKAYNITMEPGDMVLYESHSILHGRPFPLKGRYYANIFVHFAPLGKATNNGSVFPKFVANDSPEAKQYWKPRLGGRAYLEEDTRQEPSLAQLAAREGELGLLREVASRNANELSEADENGWQPLHEAARAGHTDVVKFLLEQGVDINAVTVYGDTALAIALNKYGRDHPVVRFFEIKNGKVLVPDL